MNDASAMIVFNTIRSILETKRQQFPEGSAPHKEFDNAIQEVDEYERVLLAR